MKKFPIIFGKIEKKLFLTLLFPIDLILFDILKSLIPNGNNINLINEIGGGLAQMLGIIFPYIFKYKGKQTISNAKCSKTYIKYFFIFFLIKISPNLINILFRDLLNIDYLSISNLGIDLCFGIVFFTILSIIILKSKYYIHNILSMILFCILTIIIDYIFGNLQQLELISFIYLLPLSFENLIYGYMKYLLDKKYLNYWNILFFYGLTDFIYYLFEFIIKIIKNPNDNYIFITIRNAETKYIILNFIITVVFYHYLLILLGILILDFFSLNHILMSSEISFIIESIIDCLSDFENKKLKLLFLIPALFQMLSLLFFLEILEFNFCHLNKNTKRNIMLREEAEKMIFNNDGDDLNSVGSDIEISDDLIINMNQETKNIELNELTINNESD